MPTLSISLLGPPQITVDGVAVSVDTRKAIALLAYLAATKQPHTRDALAGLLWPEYDQTHARATLRRTLSALNKALAGDWLEVARDAVRLRAGTDVYLDVDRFGALLDLCRTHGHAPAEVCRDCIEPLTEAAALYRADFLSGFGLKDSWDFDDWQHLQAESLRRDLAGALDRLSHAHAALQDYDAAVPYARRWLSLDRLHEPAHRRLMQLYAWAGQRSAALQQYRDCVYVLEKELGVAPLEATTQLYEAIKENRLPPPPALSEARLDTAPSKAHALVVTSASAQQTSAGQPAERRARASATHRSLPLIGRAAEWQRLLEAYGDVGPHGHVVIIQGEAGIGKTRLAEEMAGYAASAGSPVAAARCYEGEADLAYGPVVAALSAALNLLANTAWQAAVPPLWLAEAARLLPELSLARADLPAVPPLDSPGAQSRFFEGIRQVLLAAGGTRSGSSTGPPVLFVDDLHWADRSSLDLFTYLIRRLQDWPVCLILAWRTDQPPGDEHLHRLLPEAQRSGRAAVLSLQRLSEADVRDLVSSIDHSGSPLPQALAARLYEETEGLPFFLAEYLNALEQGVQPVGSEEWSLPLNVRDLLRSRLVPVSETGRQLLHAAAVIGRSFDFDTVHQASGRSEEETITALEELIGLGLVIEVPGGKGAGALVYDFNHEKLRGLVYEETSLARRRLLHRRVAEALAAGARSHAEAGPLAVQIAHHYRLAGNEREAAEYFRLAGEHARRLYANTEALAHLQTALALDHPDVPALHESIGDIHTLLGEYSAALGDYERAASVVTRDDAGRKTLSRLEHKLSKVYVRRGEWDLAESHLEAALQGYSVADEANERARIYADRSLAAHQQGHQDRARDLAQQALELAEAGGEPRALAQAHNILGILASRRSDHESARDHLEQSLVLTEALDEPSIRAAALNNLALVYGAGGQVDTALRLGEEALALVASQGDRHREAALHNNLADLLHAAGRSDEAMEHIKRSVTIYAEIGVEAGAYQPAIWRLVEW
ncbi:MAG TPA: AAA family ATPase [Chloroflexia bacterium]|nr:AAA family ATPase [Chloroflexia bacterium]